MARPGTLRAPAAPTRRWPDSPAAAAARRRRHGRARAAARRPRRPDRRSSRAERPRPRRAAAWALPPPARSSEGREHVARDQGDAVLAAIEAALVGDRVFADYHAVGNLAAAIDDDAGEP